MKKIKKRILTAAAALSLVLTPASAAYAEETADGTQDEPQNELEAALQESYDKKPESNSVEGWPQGPQIYGHSGIVIDMDSGAVLYEKQPDERHFPASITKLMTALVALENSAPEDEVSFSDASVAFMEYGDASIGMTPGEILSRKDAMYGMLLASANEVSYAIAESVGKLMGGDYNTFIQEMNDRAAELGCTGSHWVNANGLHDEQHYTTARDMALIASAVYQYEEFRTVTQTLEYTIGETNLMKETRTFQQNHKMLWPGNYYYYENCTGGKTGYTDQSRTTLVTMAESGGLRLVAVILQDDGDVYVDTRAMFDYAYGNFSKVYLKDQELPEEISSYEEEAPYVLLPAGADVSALEREITVLDEADGSGTVTFTYHGQNVGSADVVLSEAYLEELAAEEEEGTAGASGETAGAEEEAGGVFDFLRTLILAAAAVLLVLTAAMIFFRYRYLKRKRMRRAAARRRRQAAERDRMQAPRVSRPGHSGTPRTAGYRGSGSTGGRSGGSGRPGGDGSRSSRSMAGGQGTGRDPRRLRQEEPLRRDRNGRYR